MKILLALILVVANRGGGTATIVETSTMTVLATVDAGPQPHEVAISGRNAYVTNYQNANGSTLTAIDVDARAKTRTIPLGTLRGPHGIVEFGGKVYFTAESSSSVASYDPLTDRVDWIASTNQAGTHMLRVAPDGRAVYTANGGSGTASIIDRGAPAARKNVTAVMMGEGIDVTPDGRELWIGSAMSGGIAVIDLASETRVATISTPEPSYRITFSADGTRASVPRGRGFAVYDRALRTEVQRVATSGVVLSILATPDAVYVAMADPDQVVKLDPATFAQLGARRRDRFRTGWPSAGRSHRSGGRCGTNGPAPRYTARRQRSPTCSDDSVTSSVDSLASSSVGSSAGIRRPCWKSRKRICASRSRTTTKDWPRMPACASAS